MEFEGFMYLDVENPLVAWNTYRGVLISRNRVQQNIGSHSVQAMSMTAASIFMNKDWGRLEFENELEKIREAEFSSRPSRLTCLFVFNEVESALAAATDEAWGGHIGQENLTDVGVVAVQYARVDANWISWMLKEYHAEEPGWQAGIRPYWNGEICPRFPIPIWETLVDGRVVIWGTSLRQRAYEVIKQYSPKSVCLLEQSRLAATLASDLGHVNAIVRTEKSRRVLAFDIDMRDADNPIYTDRLKAYIEANSSKVNARDLAVGGDMFYPPNFVMYSHVFDI